MHFPDLTSDIRDLMVEEIQADVASGKVYLSKRLTPAGRREFGSLLTQAAQSESSTWLASSLRPLMAATEPGHFRNGVQGRPRKVPANAHQTLAEGEFNRFYIRAICLEAIRNGRDVEVFRAKDVTHPRPESEALLGRRLDPAQLLDELRASNRVDTALGVPPGPNSGLSVRPT